jgi:hypothetical protein
VSTPLYALRWYRVNQAAANGFMSTESLSSRILCHLAAEHWEFENPACLGEVVVEKEVALASSVPAPSVQPVRSTPYGKTMNTHIRFSSRYQACQTMAFPQSATLFQNPRSLHRYGCNWPLNG